MALEHPASRARAAADRCFPRGESVPLDRRAAPAAAAAVCVAVTIVGYGQFYSALSARPQTITLDGWLSGALTVLLIALLVVLLGATARLLLRAVSGRAPTARTQAAIVVACSLVAVAAAAHTARVGVAHVKAGRSISPSVLGLPLPWSARASTIAWLKANVSRDERALARTCVMYLGRSGRSYVVYVPADPGRAHLLAAADVMVRTPAEGDCPVEPRR